jgi:hypothetical protein
VNIGIFGSADDRRRVDDLLSAQGREHRESDLLIVYKVAHERGGRSAPISNFLFIPP